MARVLFTTQPGTGHLHPLLGLAAGLVERGHDVAVASSPSFGPEIAAAGLRPVAAGVDYVTRLMGAAFPAMAAVAPGPERYRLARTLVFAGETAGATALDLLALADGWHPDLVVREAAEYGGALAAEVLGIPHAVVRSDASSSTYADRHLVAGSLDVNRRRLGLPGDPRVRMPFRYLHLSFAPAGLDEPLRIAAPTAHRFRPGDDGPDVEPPWVAQLDPARPTVHATLGTAFNATPGLFEAIVEVLMDEPVNAVVTIGRDQDPDRLATRPGVVVAPWIPQRDVLAFADVVISHGGYGTVAASLAQGRPLVLLPISADQPINAARVTALGAGRVVDPAQRTPTAIRTALRAVLDEPRYARAAVAVARRTRRRPGLGAALDRLERLARDGLPQRRRDER